MNIRIFLRSKPAAQIGARQHLRRANVCVSPPPKAKPAWFKCLKVPMHLRAVPGSPLSAKPRIYSNTLISTAVSGARTPDIGRHLPQRSGEGLGASPTTPTPAIFATAVTTGIEADIRQRHDLGQFRERVGFVRNGIGRHEM